MQPTEELILKFFKRECTPHEAEQVYKYLAANANVLNQYLDEQEWTGLTQFKGPDEERSDLILNSVLKQIDYQPAAKVFALKPWIIGSVAACLCLFFLLFVVLNKQQQSNNNIKLAAVKQSPPFQWQNAVNHTNKTFNILLEDGSKVALAAKSAIRYKLPFQNKLRDIYLTGQAKFYVAKDKSRPFTVYAGPLATTALGTVFKITAWPNGAYAKVRLLSGKVRVVQHQQPNANAVYLTPGRELVFNHASQTAQVTSFIMPVVKPLVLVLAGITTVKGDTVSFVNQQLPQVITKLQEVYGVQITAPANLKKYSFTGDFNIRTESVTSILQTITSLNKLKATLKDSTTYIISKP